MTKIKQLQNHGIYNWFTWKKDMNLNKIFTKIWQVISAVRCVIVLFVLPNSNIVANWTKLFMSYTYGR